MYFMVYLFYPSTVSIAPSLGQPVAQQSCPLPRRGGRQQAKWGAATQSWCMHAANNL